MASWRNIEVDGDTYRWKAGRTYVVIQNAEGKRIGSPTLTAAEVKNINAYNWEEGQRDGSPEGMIRPGEISSFIRSQRK